MAVASIITPQKTKQSLVSRVHSVYNYSVFELLLDSNTTLLDKVVLFLQFFDKDGIVTTGNTYNYSVLDVEKMRRDVSDWVKPKIKTVCPLDLQIPAGESGIDFESFVAYRVCTVYGDNQTLRTDWFYGGAGVFQTYHESDGNFINYMIRLNFAGGKFTTGAIRFLTPFDTPVSFGDQYPFFLKYISPVSFPITAVGNEIELVVNNLPTTVGISNGYVEVDLAPLYPLEYLPAGEYINPILQLGFNEVYLGFQLQNLNVISETKTIETVCTDNYTDPICLFWLNSLGGWDVWVFDRPNHTTQIKGENYLTRPIDSLQTNELGTLITRSETKSIIVSQNKLNSNRYECLQEIVKSPVVYWYHTPTQYEQVQVSQSNFQKKSIDDLFTITLEISQFKVYNQF